jgi:hypothetical protein
MALGSSIPLGFDSFAHASKLLVWSKNGFWNSEWWSIWYSGIPNSLTYPWMSYMPELLVLRFADAVGLAPQQITMNLLTSTELVAEILIVAGLLLFVQKAGGSSNATLLTLLAILDSPIFFGDWLDAGRFAEIVGTVGFAWSLYFLEMFRERNNTRYIYLLAIAFWWAFACHFVTGAATIGTLLVWSLLTFPREKVARIFRDAIVPGLLLAAYWIIPFGSWLIINSRGVTTEITDLSYVSLPSVLGLHWRRYDASAAVLTVVPVLLLFVVFSPRSKEDRSRKGAFLVFSFALACYLFFVGPLLGFTYPSGLTAETFLKWALIFSACFIGLAYSSLGKLLNPNRKRVVTLALTVILLVWLPISFSVVSAPPAVGSGNGDVVTNLLLPQESRLPDFAGQQFRFGSDTDMIGQAYNFYFPMAMQTRGSSSTFVVNPDWQFYLEYNFWQSGTSAPMSEYIADWFSIKYFVSGNGAQEQAFRANPFFKEADSYRGITLFTYPDVSPIVSATNATRILVIGQSIAYNTVFRALAFSGFDSKSAITIRGSGSITSQSDLTGFDTVFLYGYTYESTDRTAMWRVLKDYVLRGGRLIVDTGFSPDAGSDLIPDPLPISKTVATNGGENWQLRAAEDPITSGIDFSSFSPAVYQGAPWGISAALNSSVRQGSRVLVWLGNNPAVVARHFGNGLAIWVGFNLPYHAVTYQNPVESLLLSRLLSSSDSSGKPRFQVTRPNMDTIETTISTPARGLLVKECYYDAPTSGWEAQIWTAKGVIDAEILRAGPDFMYVPIPANIIYPIKVVMRFEPRALTIFSDILSAFTFVYVGLSLLSPRLASRLGRLIRSLLGRIKSPIDKWWQQE